jgi:hypothetical protein
MAHSSSQISAGSGAFSPSNTTAWLAVLRANVAPVRRQSQPARSRVLRSCRHQAPMAASSGSPLGVIVRAVSSICHGGRLIRADCHTAAPWPAPRDSYWRGDWRAESRVADDVWRRRCTQEPSPARPQNSRLGPVRGRLRVGGIGPLGLVPRGIAGEARNTTAVEAGNATYWSADETSRDGAAGLTPGSRWRCGHLCQVGERTLRGRNRRGCCCAAWRLAAGATAVPGRQDKHRSTAA